MVLDWLDLSSSFFCSMSGPFKCPTWPHQIKMFFPLVYLHLLSMAIFCVSLELCIHKSRGQGVGFFNSHLLCFWVKLLCFLCLENCTSFVFIYLQAAGFLHFKPSYFLFSCTQESSLYCSIVFRLELLEDCLLKGSASHILMVPFPPKLPIEIISTLKH